MQLVELKFSSKIRSEPNCCLAESDVALDAVAMGQISPGRPICQIHFEIRRIWTRQYQYRFRLLYNCYGFFTVLSKCFQFLKFQLTLTDRIRPQLFITELIMNRFSLDFLWECIYVQYYTGMALRTIKVAWTVNPP